jgi:hypothetical protein
MAVLLTTEWAAAAVIPKRCNRATICGAADGRKTSS